ncbi:MAG: cell division protein FtsX [Paracoccaceae bacterium]
MRHRLAAIAGFLKGGSGPDRVVPPTGQAARLTAFSAAATTFLAVFALALSQAAGRLADRWGEALENTATVRISAPPEELAAQTDRVLAVLATTPGVGSARAIPAAETQKLLTPWLGPDLPVDALPLPQLVEVRAAPPGFDSEGLRLRLSAEAPGAVLDDHARWRLPLVEAAERLRLLGLVALVLIGAVTAAMITLAAQAALAANGQVIRVLRLIGARDSYIARAFVRRFTLRTFAGALAGSAAGTLAVAFLPGASTEGGFLTGLGFTGAGWLWPAALPPFAAVVAFWATRIAAMRTLRGIR